MVITLSVYLLRGIISIPAPLFKRGGHFVASSLHFVAEGAKTEQKAEDLLEVEPLVCRVRILVLRACLGVDLSKPEWLFMRYFPAARHRLWWLGF